MITINKKIVSEVLERSDGLCEVCSRQGSELHHIVFGSGKRQQQEKAESVIVLCFECHRGTMGVHGRDGRKLNIKLKKKLQETYKEQGYKEDEIRKMMGGKLYG